jgi:hypothetical protein
MNFFTALLISVVAPSVLALIQNYFRRGEKKLDWEREDAVAEKAREAAKLLLASNERVAQTSKETNGKLDVIHGLVNSQMTASMESDLASNVAQEVLMKELMSVKIHRGKKPLKEAETALALIRSKITELQSKLGDRKAAAERMASKGA